MHPFLSDDTSVTKINGKLCLVRPSRRKVRSSSSYDLGHVLSIGYDLLSEVFDGTAFRMDKDKAEAEAEKISVLHHGPHGRDPNPMAPAMQAPPQPGVYQQGNRQLVLLPKVPTGHGHPPMMHQGHFGYPQQPFMYGGQPQMVPMMGNMGFGSFNSQHDKPAAAAASAATPTSITVTQHLCANCGNLRSKKYQAAHPLEAGDTAPVSFCKKCEREFRSTDSEVEVELPTKKSRRHFRKVQREKNFKKVVYEKVMFPVIHICAQCGNPRSRKYQATHPINAGEAPPVSYCGKCQKEVTSSEDSDPSAGSEGETVTYVNKGRNAHDADRNYYRDRRIKVCVETVGSVFIAAYYELYTDAFKNTLKGTNQHHNLELDGEYGSNASKVMPPKPHLPKLLRELIFGQKVRESTPVEEYIVITDKSIDQGRKKGRQNQRPDKGDGDELPQSPLVVIREPIRRRSSELLPEGARRSRSSARRKTRHGQAQPHSERYEYDSQESSDLDGLAEKAYREYLSDGTPLHERNRSPRRSRHTSPKSQGSRRKVSAEILKEDLSEDSLAKFRETASNRRRERANLPPQNTRSAHPEIQEELSSLRDDEMLVVTERYVYRPQKSTSTVGELREERVDRGRKPRRDSQKLISQNDLAEYFPDEWSRARSRIGRHTNYQRIRPRDLDGAVLPSGQGTSEASVDQQSYHEGLYQLAVHTWTNSNIKPGTNIQPLLPPAPTPPSVSTATSGSVDTYSYSSRDTVEYPSAQRPRVYRNSRLPGEYLPSSDSGSSLGIALPEMPTRQRSPLRTRRDSHRYRPPYVRDANSGGSEGARVSSRSRSRDRVIFYSEGEEEPSDLTANDRIDKRRVAFGPNEVRMISRESLAAEGRRDRDRERERESGINGVRYGN
ncbi:hypothetical protein V494_06580 [Pseudogymnoascus sp. VKM F-4513 (FW-928)]|nr:hypothetical protein V494_06580 [Pseudogymnoascus sp. VKM F-4513 (FW-928)]